MNDPLLPQKLSRRELLRGALLGGAGLFGASLLACGDDGDSSGSPTADATATFPRQATLSAPTLTWQKLSPRGTGLNNTELPPARYDHSLVASGTHLFLFGGRDANSDLWIYDMVQDQWNNKVQANEGPSPRFGHNAVWDITRERLVIFGGQDGTTFYNDLWEYDPETHRWESMSPDGAAPWPAARYGAAACYDNEGHFIVSHGFTDTGRFDDTWQLDLAARTWTDVSPAANERPLARCLVHGAWDIIKRRLLLFGGQSTETPFLDDLWGWSPEIAWQQIARTPRPTARNLYALIYDAKRSAALLFGGRAQDGPQNDLWIFYSQGENWVQFVAQGDPPAPRYGHDMTIEPSIPPYLFGGTNGTTSFDDLWRLDAAG